MIIRERTEMTPVTITLAEQVLEATSDSEAAVLLVPDGDNGLILYYRGDGGAWWRGEETIRLDIVLRDVDLAFLITRSDLDLLLQGAVVLTPNTPD